MSVIVAIPARLKSTRFPAKVLADIHGKPMLWYVYQAVTEAKQVSEIYVLTDSQKVVDAVSSWGGCALLTSEDCPSGTDRIVSALDHLKGDIIVNVQGDEPLMPGKVIDQLVECLESSNAPAATPVYPITSTDDLTNPNIVKVVRASDDTALYFSRSPIPHVRGVPIEDWLKAAKFWGHAGVYAYKREILREFASLGPGWLENIEMLEQLRLVEAGYRFRTTEIDYRPQAVDVPADLEIVKDILDSHRE